MATLSEAQAAQAAALTQAFRTEQNREAAKMAALVALFYQQRVNVEDPTSVERWFDLVVPRLIRASDASAMSAAEFYAALRRVEVPSAPPYVPQPATGMIDEGVRRSLMAVGPGDYMNKARVIEGLDASPQQTKALLREAKKTTATKLAGATLRHARAGGRETIHRSAQEDRVALGYVRVTDGDPCFFCAALASRGLRYRAYKEDSFEMSDARFTGDGDAKVHDNCGCSLKPVHATNDPLVGATEKFAEMWARWGAGGGDAMLRFRRGYEHFRATGEHLDWDDANEGLRAA